MKQITLPVVFMIACVVTLSSCSVSQDMTQAEKQPEPIVKTEVPEVEPEPSVEEKPIETEGFTLDSTSDSYAEEQEAALRLEKQKAAVAAYFNDRIYRYRYQFGESIGIVVRDATTNRVWHEVNPERCFIPASLTKIVLSSAYLAAISTAAPGLDFEETPDQQELKTLFKRLNQYTFKTAPRANRVAVQMGRELMKMKREAAAPQSLNEVFLSHLDLVSWLEECTYVDHAAGLSINNRLAPYQVADSLYFLHGFPFYVDSLLQPGEGTLKHRFEPLRGIGSFKTGSLRRTGVISLAGFLPLGNTDLLFVFVLNDIPAVQHEDAIAWLDQTVIGLYDLFVYSLSGMNAPDSSRGGASFTTTE